MSNPYLSDLFQLDVPGMIGDLYELHVFINGEFVKGSEAKISIWDHGLLYGDGVFEGIRVYEGGIFKLNQHLDRLFDSARVIDIGIPVGQEEIRQVVLETLRRNHLRDAHLRVIVTRGIGGPGLDPRNCKQASLIVMAYPFPPLLGSDPIRLISSSVRRKAPYAVDARVKSLNYLDNILAKLQAILAGVDDAIMLDMSGCIAEATAENIFSVKKGVISTPLLTAALPGITRSTVIDLANDMGCTVQERPMTLGDLYVADEVFLTGTGAEIVPVGEIDGRVINDGQVGEFTARIIENGIIPLTKHAARNSGMLAF